MECRAGAFTPRDHAAQDRCCERRPRYAISGVVRGADGSGIDGATIEVAGYGSATTDGTGAYLVPNVDEGLRTITASLDESLFDPIVRTVMLTSDLTSQDFVSVPTERIATVTFDVTVPITTSPRALYTWLVRSTPGILVRDMRARRGRTTTLPSCRPDFTITA